MRDDAARRRFPATISRGGTISVPAAVRSLFRPGQPVQVTIAAGHARRGRAGVVIDEDEVTWIAALQAEPPGVVRRCLEAQGALAGFSSRKRPGRANASSRVKRRGAGPR